MQPRFDATTNTLYIVDPVSGDVLYEFPINPDTGNPWTNEQEALAFADDFIAQLPPDIIGLVDDETIQKVTQELLAQAGFTSVEHLMLAAQLLEAQIVAKTQGSITGETIRQTLAAIVTGQTTTKDQAITQLTQNITDPLLQQEIQALLNRAFDIGLIIYALARIPEFKNRPLTELTAFLDQIKQLVAPSTTV